MQLVHTLLAVVLLLSAVASLVHWHLLTSTGRPTVMLATHLPRDVNRHTLVAHAIVKQDTLSPRRGEKGVRHHTGEYNGALSNTIPWEQLRHEGNNKVDPSHWPPLDQHNTISTVLLDTGDYVFKEKNMKNRKDSKLPSRDLGYPQHTGSTIRTQVSINTESTTQRVITAHSETKMHLHSQGLSLSHKHSASDDQSGEERSVAVLQLGELVEHVIGKKEREQAGDNKQKSGDGLGKMVSGKETMVTSEQRDQMSVHIRSKKEYYSHIAQMLNNTSQHPPWHSHSLNSYSPPSSSPSSSSSTSTIITTTSSTHIHCSTLPCLEFLTGPERYIYSKCRRSTAVPCKCRFVDGTGRKTVALVSLPGSGNTWVRGILETATGICSGSLYCDRSLREGGFCGEGLRGSNLIVVKTHDSSLSWRGGNRKDNTRPVFDKAIFLIRNPFGAIIAEWNRQLSRKYASGQQGNSHTKYISNPSFFGEDNIRIT